MWGFSVLQAATDYAITSHSPGDPSSTTHQLTGRDLLTPDEIMQMSPHLQFLRLQGRPMILARKLRGGTKICTAPLTRRAFSFQVTACNDGQQPANFVS